MTKDINMFTKWNWKKVFIFVFSIQKLIWMNWIFSDQQCSMYLSVNTQFFVHNIIYWKREQNSLRSRQVNLNKNTKVKRSLGKCGLTNRTSEPQFHLNTDRKSGNGKLQINNLRVLKHLWSDELPGNTRL